VDLFFFLLIILILNRTNTQKTPGEATEIHVTHYYKDGVY